MFSRTDAERLTRVTELLDASGGLWSAEMVCLAEGLVLRMDDQPEQRQLSLRRFDPPVGQTGDGRYSLGGGGTGFSVVGTPTFMADLLTWWGAVPIGLAPPLGAVSDVDPGVDAG